MVDALFLKARAMSALLTPDSTKEEIVAYETVLTELVELWQEHNRKTVVLLNRCVRKLNENKHLYFNRDFC
tara:strand:- start:177 stop:389 length:213 start_codon:yes stop_codon:yes gene_type:complete